MSRSLEEIYNLVSAMARDIGERFQTLEKEQQEFRADITERIERLEGKVDQLEQRAERLEQRSEVIEREVRDLRGDMSEVKFEVLTISARFDRFEARALENRADLRELNARVARLEGKPI